jgi:hypothetical protein
VALVIFRRRQRFSVGTALTAPVGLSVVLSPDDFLSSLLKSRWPRRTAGSYPQENSPLLPQSEKKADPEARPTSKRPSWAEDVDSHDERVPQARTNSPTR